MNIITRCPQIAGRRLAANPISNKLIAMTKLNAAIKFDGKWFVSRCLDLPVTSQGTTAEEARRNLAEAIELYIETWGSDELETSVGEPQLATVEVAV